MGKIFIVSCFSQTNQGLDILNVSFTPKREVFCETNDVLCNEASH
jgi:hypothetical protein